MSHKYQAKSTYDIYFITFTVVDWVDIFIRPVYKQIIVGSLKYCQHEKGLIVHAWCLMTNHLHLLVSVKDGFAVSDFVRDFKKFTNRRIIAGIFEERESRKEWMIYRFRFHARFSKRVKDYKVWQDGYHAIICDDNRILAQKLDYIHHNPVLAEFVAYPEEYLYSSARDYSGEGGLLEIDKIDDGFSGLVRSVKL